ncbi:30S ribosomal protein S20 [Lentibacillus amyloliquefaciens]|uniref:Small ribosomal subunit protein bS20 n=1 Tax=Lentibacillus amyloliquefaciens TaxID=1472767 RepID=A0A0U4EC49_9BACI|nr:30S ribosomal protein S20 [Lentibacillus amyloliquefaciens]ALX48137.1 30S ribosomal protein S20 [Lentibacillus amyloliquefaciens]
MANIKSAIKRVEINQKKRTHNIKFKSDMRTQIKRLEKMIDQNDAEGANAALPATFKKIDKAVQKGGIHKNTGNREKSRLAQKINELQSA